MINADADLNDLADNNLKIDEKYLKILKDWRLSPALASLEEIISLPPTIIYICEHDVLRDDGELMYKRFRTRLD